MDSEAENDFNESTATKNSRKSAVWRYFKIVNKTDMIALCQYCHETYCYRSSVSNLKKHLMRKHPDKLNKVSDNESEHLDETYLEEEESEDVIDKRKVLRSTVWEHFEVTDEFQRKATCNLCHEELSFRTTSTNLMKHLKRRHYISVTNDEEIAEELGEQEYNISTTEKNSRKSVAWNYFDIKDPEKRIAVCKLCGSQFSYLTSVSNLMKHIVRKHGVSVSDQDGINLEFTTVEKKEDIDVIAGKSTVWLYFKSVNRQDRLAVCLICKKQLSYMSSISNLKKHLLRKHPNVSLNSDEKKMLLSSDGQLYEVEENCKPENISDDDDVDQNAEPMEIYLDEMEGNIVEKPVTRPKRNSSKFRKNKMAATDSDSDSTEMTFRKRYVKNKADTLDHFGKYIVSLLRQMPDEISNQLQVDFVKQIMACRSCDVTGNGYSVTETTRETSPVTTTIVSNSRSETNTTE